MGQLHQLQGDVWIRLRRELVLHRQGCHVRPVLAVLAATSAVGIPQGRLVLDQEGANRNSTFVRCEYLHGYQFRREEEMQSEPTS